MAKNPFEVLGLNQAVVGSLDNSGLQYIINSQFRALQQIFHPDKGGDEKRSKEINDAYSELDRGVYTPKLAAFKAAYLRKATRDRMSLLESELQQSEEKTQAYYMKIIDFLLAYSQARSNVPANQSQGYTIFNIAPGILHMHDWVRSLEVDVRNYKVKKKCFHDLELDLSGHISRVDASGKRNFPKKTLMGGIPSQDLGKYGGMKSLLKRVHDFITWPDIMLNYQTRQMGKRTPLSHIPFENMISPEQFYTLMPLLRPELQRSDFLFSLNLDHELPYFQIEGVIIRIEKN